MSKNVFKIDLVQPSLNSSECVLNKIGLAGSWTDYIQNVLNKLDVQAFKC